MVDWSDPQTFWLNLLHAALGGTTVAVLVAVACAFLLDIRDKVRSKER